MTSIEASTTIHAPIQRCFALSLNLDIELLAAAKFHLKAVSGVTSGQIGPGQRVTWKTQQFGITVAHTTEITGYREPSFFEDSMVKGLFRSFCHKHFFQAQSPTTTVMSDTLSFSFPLLLGGLVVERTLVQRRLYDLLMRRDALIKQHAESKNH